MMTARRLGPEGVRAFAKLKARVLPFIPVEVFTGVVLEGGVPLRWRHIAAAFSLGLVLSPLAALGQVGVVSSGSAVIPGTSSFDFDTGTIGSLEDPGMDVFWEQITASQRQMVPITSTFLEPLGVARDPAHSAGIVNVGLVDFSASTPTFLQGLTYGSSPINGNNDPLNQLVPGDVFAVHTSDGNYAEVKILTYGYNLQVQWVTVVPSRFLAFPLDVTCEGRPCTPFTAKISAIQDHSVPTGYNCNKKGNCDGIVRAYNGEEGKAEYGKNCAPPGYKNASGTPFLVNVLNYRGDSGCAPDDPVDSGFPERFLNYDGHAGYDFPYGKDKDENVPILAPANGTLFQAMTDSINGANGKDTAWEGFHTFYIDHGNGYTTWYLHCRTLAPQVWEAIKQKGSAQVKQGEMIAYVGDRGAASIHLHFEVRRGMDEVIDPYAQKLWKDDRKARSIKDIGPQAVWNPPSSGTSMQDECKGVLVGFKTPQFTSCVTSIMKQEGASSEAVAFTELIQGDGWMDSFREMGQVDCVTTVTPFRANDNGDIWLVNGNPKVVQVGNFDDLKQIDITQDPLYSSLIRQYPKLMLWSTHSRLHAMQRLPRGGQRFIFSFDLLNGCHACGLVGHAHFAYDFDDAGNFLGIRFVQLTNDKRVLNEGCGD